MALRMKLPHEVERMGDALRIEVEHQLLEDLKEYRPDSRAEGLSIDWTDAIQEGHCARYQGRMLESLSDIRVRDHTGSVVARGWMDFVHGSEPDQPFIFWLFLGLHEKSGVRRQVKEDLGIPQHVWDRIPAPGKNSVLHDAKWKRDPKVIAWGSAHPPASE